MWLLVSETQIDFANILGSLLSTTKQGDNALGSNRLSVRNSAAPGGGGQHT